MYNSTPVEEKRNEGFLGQKMLVLPRNIRRGIQNNDLIRSLYLTDVGYYPHARHHFVERKSGTREYILIYCIDGHGWIEINSIRHKLYPNSYYIIPRATSHKYWTEKDDPWSIYWIHFTGENADRIFNRFQQKINEQNNGTSVLSISFNERRKEHFDTIINCLENGYSNANIEYVNLILWELLTSFIYDSFFSNNSKGTLEKDFIDRAIDYMQNHLDRSITVQELAAHLNYSTSYLYSIFKEKTGYSPIDYFNHLKIQKACQYLSFTGTSVKEICYELGYNDPCYFSRIFKKFTDLSPTKYRERYGT